MQIGIAAIVKNEGPYIVEWVAYHRSIGVDRFFIANNNSTDETTDILVQLSECGIVDHIWFPHVPDHPPQLPAYGQIISRHAKDVDWLLFIDADEFLVPTDGQESIKPFFLDAFKRPEIDRIAINWANYGSSGAMSAEPDPVVVRFVSRAEKNWPTNQHYKMAVRTSSGPITRGSPHHFSTITDHAVVHTDMTSLSFDPTRGEGLSSRVVWDRLRLNHYVVKSHEEFYNRKGPKGRATVVGKTKGESYFIHHDRNEVDDPINKALLLQMNKEIASISAILAAAGDVAQVSAPPDEKASRTPVYRACIDSAQYDGQQIVVRGWAMADFHAIPELSLKLSGFDAGYVSRLPVNRPDVARHIVGASADTGFVFRITARALADVPTSNWRISLIAREPTGSSEIANGTVSVSSAYSPPRAKSRSSRLKIVNVVPCNIGNQMFRYMLGTAIQRSVKGAVLTGANMPEWGIIAKKVDIQDLDVKEVGPNHRIDVIGLAYELDSGKFDAISVDCYAQRMEYFYKSRGEFASEFYSPVVGDRIEDDEIAINVRSAEIVDGLHPDYMPLPISYYRAIVAEAGLKPVFVGQVRGNWYSDALRAAFPDARYVSGKSWVEDFQTIRGAKNVALAISSFSWLAGWLSDSAQRIYLPLAGFLNPIQRPDIQLVPISDERYIYHRFPVFAYTGSDEQRAAIVGREKWHVNCSPADVSQLV
jgi:glycosyltransferase involved in cell wall biosynthesis